MLSSFACLLSNGHSQQHCLTNTAPPVRAPVVPWQLVVQVTADRTTTSMRGTLDVRSEIELCAQRSSNDAWRSARLPRTRNAIQANLLDQRRAGDREHAGGSCLVARARVERVDDLRAFVVDPCVDGAAIALPLGVGSRRRIAACIEH